METLNILRSIEKNQAAALKQTQDAIRMLEQTEEKPKRDFSHVHSDMKKVGMKKFKKIA